jgi:hypothetical protein
MTAGDDWRETISLSVPFSEFAQLLPEFADLFLQAGNCLFQPTGTLPVTSGTHRSHSLRREFSRLYLTTQQMGVTGLLCAWLSG